jgi:hypothetical protein
LPATSRASLTSNLFGTTVLPSQSKAELEALLPEITELTKKLLNSGAKIAPQHHTRQYEP